MPDLDGRRPLKVREAGFAQSIARWLSGKNITPNQISIISVFFAALAAICLFALPNLGGSWKWILPIATGVFIQFRLLCNLFDGMVAVEGGKSTASGELFNDIPDRIADPLILVAVGYAGTVYPWSTELGWTAGLLSVMTAYIRTLSAGLGAPSNFQGPMAKQHRMALVTIASIFTAIEPFVWPQGWSFTACLAIIVLGCIITVWRRIRSAYTFLENR